MGGRQHEIEDSGEVLGQVEDLEASRCYEQQPVIAYLRRLRRTLDTD